MTDKTPQENIIYRRTKLSQPVGNLVENVAKQSFRKHGIAETRLITEWQQIAGPVLSRYCVPQKLYFAKGKRDNGTLHLLVESAWALEVQHLEPQLLEKIATYFGYRAVASLRIKQGPLPLKPVAAPKSPPPVDAKQRKVIEKNVAGVDDPGLREALSKLGETLVQKQSKLD